MNKTLWETLDSSVPKWKILEKQVWEERFDFNTAFAFINTLLWLLLRADIPVELSYNQ